MHDVGKKQTFDQWVFHTAITPNEARYSKRPAHKQRSLIGYRQEVCRGLSKVCSAPLQSHR